MLSTLLTMTLDFQEQAKTSGRLESGYTYETAGQAFADWIGFLLSLVMTIALLALLLNLVWGALEWVNSGGEKSKIESARSRMTTSVIGIIVLSSVLALFMLIQYFLNIEVLSFSFGNAATTPQCPAGATWVAEMAKCCQNGACFET